MSTDTTSTTITTDDSTDTAGTSTDTTTSTTDSTTSTDTLTDTAEDLAKWKALSRQHEKASKAAQAELDKLRKASMSDTEKAIEEARKAARSEVLAELGSELVDSAVRVAANGRLDVDTMLEGLDRSKFLDEDGKPDTKKIGAWIDKLAPKGEAKRPVTDAGQGARGKPTGVLTREHLKTMTSAEIEAARQAGQLDHILRG